VTYFYAAHFLLAFLPNVADDDMRCCPFHMQEFIPASTKSATLSPSSHRFPCTVITNISLAATGLQFNSLKSAVFDITLVNSDGSHSVLASPQKAHVYSEQARNPDSKIKDLSAKPVGKLRYRSDFHNQVAGFVNVPDMRYCFQWRVSSLMLPSTRFMDKMPDPFVT
jgi:hypothetical protein